MGHRDLKTTQIYADHMPGEGEAQLIDAAFGGTPAVDHTETV